MTLVAMPLHFLGVIGAKSVFPRIKAPIRPNNLEKPILTNPAWFRILGIVLAGAAPFSVIALQVNYSRTHSFSDRPIF